MGTNEEQQEPHYVDRSGGAPFRVDGPGCTPATVSPAAAAGRAAAERVLRESGALDMETKLERGLLDDVQEETEDQEDEERIPRCRAGHLSDEECPECWE